MGRKRKKRRQAAVDSSGNIIEVMTIQQAAKYLGILSSELRLQLYMHRNLPYYKCFTKKGRRVVRIKKKDLDDFKLDTEMFDRIADRIVAARKEHVYVKKGLSQADLSKEARISVEHLNRIELKRLRVGIPALKRISRVLDKPLIYFLD